MLYVTTRNNRDAFTVNRAMREKRGADGGHYLPFRHPRFSEAEMDTLLEQPFGHCVAQVLNLQFHTKLSGSDVEKCVGNAAIRLDPLPHRILLAQCWHTVGSRFSGIYSGLSARVAGETIASGGWMEIGIRIAVLFGVFSELRKMGIQVADISCVSGDFAMPISAWYAKQWGLPVGNILCCCNENNSLWELFAHGQLRTDGISIPTRIPAADVAVPDHLERLIYACGGMDETKCYLDACRTGKSYCPPDALLGRIRRDVAVSVVSSQRIDSIITGVYRTHGRMISPSAALAYGGLLDHRSKTGSIGYVLVWSEEDTVAEQLP